MADKDYFWTTKDAGQFHKMPSFKEICGFPEIVANIKRLNPKTFLDYGCGSGKISTIIDPKIEKTLFDINLDNIPFKNELDKYNCKIASSASELKSDYYDVALLSFVLICIKEDAVYEEILANVRRVLKKDGHLILFDVHPCFMQYNFSYMPKETENVSFSYFEEGAPYTKYLLSTDGKTNISFVDYHRTLSFMINKLANAGFAVKEMVELPDKSVGPNEPNKMYPPIFYFICQ